MTIAVIIGSLRIESYNRQLAKLAISRAPEGIEIVEISIADLPLFNQDLESQLPESVQAFKQSIRNADGLLIITPEYNRSIPGVLKNAIDWASRPESALAGKPVGIMGASDGQFGTITAQFDLRRVLSHTNCLVLPQPQVLVTKVKEKIFQGAFDEATTKVVNRYIQTLTGWVERNSLDKGNV